MQLTPARPTPEDARHFTELAQIAADQLFTELVGSRADALLRGMYLRADNENSHRHCMFIRVDGEVAGMIHAQSAMSMRAHRTRSFLLMLWLAGWGLPRFLMMMLLLGDLLSFAGENLADDDFYITFVALYPQFRGRGLSKALLQHAQDSARRTGCKRLALDVDAKNAIAIAAYERVSFRRIAASAVKEIDGETVQLQRMVKDIPRTPPTHDSS